MSREKTCVHLDEHGVPRVADTMVMLDSIVAAFQLGHSPETIQRQYPSSSLGDVYGAVTYYLENEDEVDRYLKRQSEVWEEWRSKANQAANPVVQRLRNQIVGTAAGNP